MKLFGYTAFIMSMYLSVDKMISTLYNLVYNIFQIPLGVLDKDETKITDMTDIMKEYTQYVPHKRDGSPLVLPLYGDGLSVERSYDAQTAMINAAGPFLQLQGLHPSIQEWHKRGILLQVR